jgi:gamma-glutamylcyclotransferase (GGCT)/AIG2-like uncharacterized protein YtfP
MSRTAANTPAMDDPAMDDPAPLFVYGTLMFPEILRALTGRVPDSTAAAAAGWRAAALLGRRYPGLVPGPSLVRGRLISGLSAGERQAVHAFEDGGYELRGLVLADGRLASAYVWTRDGDVLPADWDPAAFAARDLGGYVERLTGARQPREDGGW